MSTPPADAFDLPETTIADVRTAIADGRVTAEALLDRYLARIDAYDDDLNAILTLNDGARERARDLDARYAEEGFVGPLHGVPTLLKDNQDTHDMPTTAGSVALADSVPPRDAFVVERLRDAGAVVVGKANLQELSFGVDTISSLGGATRNAYDLNRRPSGSSGGTAAAVAANLATVGTGSDTCSSVRSPPAFNNLVGLRPTRGLVSRTGIVPLSETQDTAGPVTRTVADAARLLDAMAGYDPEDPVTATGADAVPDDGYASHLDPDGLDGARIGVARQFLGLQGDSEDLPVDEADAAAVTAVVEEAIEEMEAAGATVLDPVDVVDVDLLGSARVLQYEFARDFDRYLARLGDAAPHGSLAEVYETGTIAPSIESRFEGAGIFDVDADSLEGDAGYLRRLRRRDRLAETVLARMVEDDLDALLYPPSTVPPVEIPEHQPFSEMNCELSAHTGLPAVVLPAGFTDEGLPVGVELLGRRFAEPRLLELGYGFERSSGHRRPPERFGELDDA
ncbi:amidase [Halogeometricum luteum]|uniref:Amidase family protein n=1 Tax=Halogeometricum luteum TaxID=2950537 RepID=A0ABU2G4W6_9EURY|nr:amidase family protein [Halogeometricum sp. S3BR5-2]MDS0295536.1 amidase family protein [Halogeometricum sp. S3BR5-2]